ncbi:dnaJ homolog subfamily C member 30, mitochondrial [Leptinotarsa decemlineata]|uniref:dnaJ homolog subfamily C member 30, mitochondrial n=1 Tax=Leptinotarsa decemlineata TaxID=7539 RepID=UPI000C254B8E|nr:dnaJ homolog subfamily C member 30-like [Leptinotarsa decemlineata]XP_023012784.1 dnaJ homolog subfamily C member 30-like [Leptinotarsa decemlineata]
MKKIFNLKIRNQIRLMSSVKPKDHYKSLGITPSSTQGEIKSAYYKLSMVYHPDKNQDSNAQSAQKFRDITEAYEVLGNIKTRKLYDKGLYFRSTPSATEEDVDKFYKSRETRSRPPPPSSGIPIYDFDEWSKSHYGATFRRQMENKNRTREYIIRREKEKEHTKIENMLLVFLGISFMFMLYFKETDYDKVYVNNKPGRQLSKEASS